MPFCRSISTVDRFHRRRGGALVTQPLPHYPLIRRHLFAITLERDDVFVLAEEDHTWLQKGRGLGALLTMLDGTRSVSDLLELAPHGLSPPEVMFLLNQLHASAMLAEGGPSLSQETVADLAFWHALDLQNPSAVAQIGASRVRLRELDPWGSAIMQRGLERAGLKVMLDGDAGALDVVATDHYFRPELDEFNRAALANGNPWMTCKLVGQTLWIGPIFHAANRLPGLHAGSLAAKSAGRGLRGPKDRRCEPFRRRREA